MGNLQRARGYYRQYLDLEPRSQHGDEVRKLIEDIDAKLSAERGQARSTATPSPPVNLAPVAVDDEELPDVLKASPPHSAEKREGRPFYGRWWFWAAVGGAVAAGALTVVIASRPSGGDYIQSGTWGDLGK
jgi:hypothetical protein